MQIYKFGNCYLNTTERRVVKNGNYLGLTPKTFDVLQLLVENCGEIVTKDELLGKVWNGSFVEEGNLAVHISKLRRLLDETKNEPFIETAQGSGYRFISPAKLVSEDEWKNHLPDKSRLQIDKSSEKFIIDSIAVLPLKNESNDAEIDYLADGLTESFINNLARITNLKVIARNTVFRYRNKEADAKEIGETLGVATVLTGRIKFIKDNLMISVELIKVADGTQLWGTQFNQPFSAIIEVQEKITFEVSEKLKSEIGYVASNSPSKPITNNAESYRLYLKGKYLLEKRIEEAVHQAIKCFEKSVSYDPMNVYSYIGMIESYFMLYFTDYISYSDACINIEPILSIISKLDQNVDMVQAMLGRKKMYFDWKFEEAEKHFQYALILNPNCLIARHRYTDFLLLSGKFSEALKELQQIMLIDPLSLVTYKQIGRVFYRMGQFENAINYLKDAVELEPTDYVALAILGVTLMELENYDEALVFLEKSLDSFYTVEVFSMIGSVYARSGRKDKARQIIKQIESRSKNNSQHSIKLARIYMGLGETEIAYRFLEQAFDQHDVDFIALNSDPSWAAINNEPRFKEIIKKLGFPIIKGTS